jgi:membrane protein implicated in regulation of membrane protease activity
MMLDLASRLGPWSWWIIGLMLLVAELAAPGVFLIWIGMAAIVVGALSLALWTSVWWSWQAQLLLFGILSIGFALAGRRIYAARSHVTDEPMLNRRSDSLVGRTAVLVEPIEEGRGRIRLDDTWWPASGHDLPSGTRVVVVSAEGNHLKVEKA